MADEKTSNGLRISDPKVMRALAHPARIEIVERMNTTGDAMTATECAELVGLSPSATSYHLRELAKYGLIEPAPSRGDGRERVWRTAAQHLQISADDQGPETHAAELALVDLYLNRDYERLRWWLANREEETGGWSDAGTVQGASLLVTPEELKALNQRVHDLLEPFQMRGRKDDPPEGAREVRATYLSFPVRRNNDK